MIWGLLLVAALGRALVPAGYMPDPSGRHLITICTGSGAADILVDGDNQPVPDAPRTGHDCPFAILVHQSSAPPPAAAQVTPPPSHTAMAETALPRHETLTVLRRAVRQYSRGPPRTA